MSKRPRMLAVLGLGLAACIIAAANLAPVSEAPSLSAADSPRPGSVGLRAFVDPETGALREATAEDLAKAALEHPVELRKDADIQVIQHANGMKSAVLDESFMSTSVVKVGIDGRLITDCVSSREEYDAFFADTAPSAGPEVQ